MNTAFEQFGFSVETTKDGSPTLRLGDGESMHHSAGAASETRYIYKSVIDVALQKLQTCRTGVVGLGLGYIEISWAQCLLELKIKPTTEITIDSYETVKELRDLYSDWIQNRKTIEIYDQISLKLEASIDPPAVQKTLCEAYLQKSGLHRDALQIEDIKKWNVICYDAFSQKTSGPLWEEAFLNELIQKNAHEDCVFTTYACTGTLKKVLTENGFYFFKRPGFSGKRDSTLALRGIFKDYLSLFQTSSCSQ